MNLSIKREIHDTLNLLLLKTYPAARGMKPERQAAVDSIPPVYLNYYRFLLSETIKPKLRFKLFYDQD